MNERTNWSWRRDWKAYFINHREWNLTDLLFGTYGQEWQHSWWFNKNNLYWLIGLGLRKWLSAHQARLRTWVPISSPQIKTQYYVSLVPVLLDEMEIPEPASSVYTAASSKENCFEQGRQTWDCHPSHWPSPELLWESPQSCSQGSFLPPAFKNHGNISLVLLSLGFQNTG